MGDGYEREEEWQQAQIGPTLDVVLDPPVDVSTVTMLWRCRSTPGEEVEKAVMARVSEEIGDGKGDQPTRWVSPAQHLLEAGSLLTSSKARGDDLVQRHELDCARS
jgi:hypothetical protein